MKLEQVGPDSRSELDGFVTVAEAAQQLGISVRTAQRDAAKLSDNDRQWPTRGAMRVRLSALRALRGQIPEENYQESASDNDATRRDNDGQSAPGTAELIAALQETIRRQDLMAERLNAALEKAQALHLATAGELQAARRRAEELEEQNCKLIAALPGSTPAEPILPNVDNVPPNNSDAGKQDSFVDEIGTNETRESHRLWWQFWKDRRRSNG